MRAGENKIFFSREEAEKGRERLRQFKIELCKLITEEAWKHFPGLAKLDLEKFDKFQQIVSEASETISFKINNLQGKSNRKSADISSE